MICLFYMTDMDGSDIIVDICEGISIRQPIHDLCPDVIINTTAAHEGEKHEATLLPSKGANLRSAAQHTAFAALDDNRAREKGIDFLPDWREGLKEYAAARRLSERATAQ